MSNTRDDTATIEYVEGPATERLRESQAFRAERYRLACETDPESVKAYEIEVQRRRDARLAQIERDRENKL